MKLIAFLNDILIFRSIKKKCQRQTQKTLQCFKDAKLYCKELKCLFKIISVDFLSFIMRNEEIVMNSGCVSIIIE